MFGRGGCGVLGALGWELVSERVDWVAGVLWVLGHTKEGEPGAASGWPRRRRGGGRADGRGGVAKKVKLQREGKRAARSSGATRGCHVRRRAK